MPRQIPEKCLKCAALSADQAKLKHGVDGVSGDRCWDSKRCPSRRSYARNRDRINLNRSRLRAVKPLTEVTVDVQDWLNQPYAILHIWREARENSPVHAVSIAIWQGKDLIATVPPTECIGAVPAQIHRYLQKALELLGQQYRIQKFVSISRHDPKTCPVNPCSLDRF